MTWKDKIESTYDHQMIYSVKTSTYNISLALDLWLLRRKWSSVTKIISTISVGGVSILYKRVHMVPQFLWFRLLRTPKIIRTKEKVIACYDMKAQAGKNLFYSIWSLSYTMSTNLVFDFFDFQKTIMIDLYLFSFILVYCQQRECSYIYHIKYKLMVILFDHVISSNVTYILACLPSVKH